MCGVWKYIDCQGKRASVRRGPTRGFTIRLERLKPRAPDFGGAQSFGSKPKVLGVRTISSISVSDYICIFVLIQHTFFTMPLAKDLYKNKSKRLKRMTKSILFSWR